MLPFSTDAAAGWNERLVNRVTVGAYVHLDGQPHADPVAPEDLAEIEDALGRPFDLVHYFFTWGRSFDEAINDNAYGRDLMLSMKPDGTLIDDINNGDEDGYIDQFAADATEWGNPVYVRFGHEMNGEWMSYSAGYPGGPSAADFKDAWTRVVDRFRNQDATNVKFVWCPNESDFPNQSGNHMEDYWPGDQYVDVAAFDAYNWSNQTPTQGDGTWRTFDQIVEGPYTRITGFTARPIWLGEFGTVEAQTGVDPAGASKGRWFREMFDTIRFPRLQRVVYFSEHDTTLQRDWRLDSSSGSLTGFKEGWSS